MSDDRSDLHLAIIGMSARFAGASSADAFWENIRAGRECVTDFSAEELLARGVPAAVLRDPHYVPRAPVLDDMESFDAGFFGLTPKEGAIMDPQHRHFLECAWEAFESAGQPPGAFDGPIGVYAGNGMQAYMMYNLISNPGLMESEGMFLVRHTGNDKDFLSTRVSYALDLRGPSVTVQTACSTSLVAIHMATQALLNGEIDMALAGGVTIELPHRVGYKYEPGEILSPDGSCRAFDAASQGTVFGSGCGVVLIRRLHDALDDGDPIHAVIIGSAINNDGASKVGYLAPSVEGQARCVTEALELAEVDARSVSYVECHGTGTPVGDPIEISALTQAFRGWTDDVGYCGVGSVKTNIGHTDTAAGVASVIKVAQALKHKELPKSLGFERPNPALGIETSPFFVSDTTAPWRSEGPRRAGVNSLGVGGTNAFLLLEEPPAPQATSPAARGPQLLLASGKSRRAADATADALAAWADANPDALADAAHTTDVGRTRFGHRAVALASPGAPARVVASGEADDVERSVAFLFAGGGAQYANMGRELYDTEPVYKEAVDACLGAFASHIDYDLRALIYCEAADESKHNDELRRPTRTLPSLFTAQFAQAKLWMSWGVEPDALIGHSMGEYTAACLSGVLSLADAAGLVALRGRLFEAVEPGGMTSVQLDASELEPLLTGGLCLAASNAPGLSLASGPIGEIEALEAAMAARDITTRRVHIEVAAHSSMLDPILDEFRAYFGNVRFGEMRIPVVSNLSGEWAGLTTLRSADYWVRHLREPVRFDAGVRTLLEDEGRVAIEVGPGRTMATLARMSDAVRSTHVITNSARHPEEDASDVGFMLERLAEVWCRGLEPDWAAVIGGQRRRIQLPAYQWDHRELWIAPGEAAYTGQASTRATGRIAERGDWGYRRSWRDGAREGAEIADGPVVLFEDRDAAAAALRARLEARGRRVARVVSGERYLNLGGGTYQVNPRSEADHARAWRELTRTVGEPVAVLDARPCAARDDDLRRGQTAAFEGPYNLLRALANTRDVRVVWLADRLFNVGDEGVDAVQSLVLGPARVAPSEMDVSCAAVDARVDDWSRAGTVDAIVDELLTRDAAREVALRRGRRWVSSWEASPLDEARATDDDACVLISGGFGALGLAAAARLVSRGVRRIALIGRTAPPERDSWDAWLASHDARDRTTTRIEAVRALEAAGATVVFAAVDIADRDALAEVVEDLEARVGAITSVIHAAGAIDDDLLALKPVERAQAVLAPKLHGTAALAEVLSDRTLTNFVLYGSVSAVAGLPGQVDYAAANAFLDAFAQRRADAGLAAVCVGWPAWTETGMAVDLAAAGDDVTHEGRATDHPFLGTCVRETAHVVTYLADLSPDHDWILDEHRLADGTPLIPGTGYVELARAAATDGAGDVAVEFSDIAFLQPCVVLDGTKATVRTELRRRDDGRFDFVVSSGGRNATDVEHARGVVGVVARPKANKLRYGAIRKRCAETQTFPAGPKADPHLRFGHRWSNLREAAYGADEALLTLALPDDAAGEAAVCGLHPALLDFATAGAQRVAGTRDGLLVPVGYQHLTLRRALPAEAYSHVSLRSQRDGLVVFDVVVADRTGGVCAEVRGFTMREVDGSFGVAPPERGGARVGRSDDLANSIARGVTTDEGLDILERVWGGHSTASVYVSPVGIDAAIHDATPEASAVIIASDAPDDVDFVAPRSDAERTIAAIWSEAMGIGEVGVTTDFFALGGHSLVAIRVLSRINQTFGTELPLGALFDGPTVAELAANVEEITGVNVPDGDEPEPEEAPTTDANDAIRRVARDGLLQPSAGQAGLWFLQQSNPGSSAYNVPFALRLRGAVDAAALDRALVALCARHEATRTVFLSENGAPMCRIVEPPISVLQVEALAAGETAQAFANRVAGEAFPLDGEPLFRATLGTDAAGAVLVVTMHHIVSDEWSLEIVLDELGALYRAALGEQVEPLAALPVQYADFAAWMRARGEGGYSKALDYWIGQLGAAPKVLELPTDRPRPAVATYEGAREVVAFGRDLGARVRAFAAESGATPYVVLLAAFQAFMSRLSGQRDLLVASPSSTRSRAELERVVGFFVNTIVLRADLHDAPDFRALVARTRATAVDAFAHAELPFDALVRALDVPRDPSRNPLYQVMFALFPADREVDFGALEVEHLHVDAGGAQVDLTLYLADADEGLTGIFEYNTALFDRATMAGWARAFETFVDALLVDPDQPYTRAAVVDVDAGSVVRGPVDADAPNGTIHGLFEAQRKRRPDAVAVVAPTLGADAPTPADSAPETWTYRELDQRANQIARELIAAGVTPGDRVGVCLKRHGDLVAALLGVMKCGAAYVPLDPGFPADRIRYMLSHSQAPVLVTESALEGVAPAYGGARLVIDRSPSLAAQSDRKPRVAVSPDDAAYVIYTSGSTGKPKGVQIPHRAASNFMHAMAARPGFGPHDVLLAVTTISFDISVLELFLPLSAGGSVVLLSKADAMDPMALIGAMETYGVSVLQATPATWQLLLAAGWDGAGIRALCGGEAMPVELAQALVPRVDALWNMYGPTETTIWSSVAEIDDPSSISIGHPILNTQCYVLDAELCLVPPGVPGDLWIAGDGVADGYVRRPDLSAERFVDDPIGGGRMYLTGDLARVRADGSLDYLGRTDNQVKVRGYRIELGEIEAVLTAHPGVGRAVVHPYRFGATDLRLVAYVTCADGLDASALKSWVGERLPDYMVPAVWERVEAYPLTANGKVDRKALAPTGASPGAKAGDAASIATPRATASAPRAEVLSPREQLVADAWTRALQLPDVARSDNFFDLGGHSLLAMTVIHELATATGHRLNPLELSMQTLAQVAASLPADAETSAPTVPDGDATERGAGTTAGPAAEADGAVAGAREGDAVGRATGGPTPGSAEWTPPPGEHRRLLKKALRRVLGRGGKA